MLQAAILLATFVSVLWALSAEFAFVVRGHDLTLPRATAERIVECLPAHSSLAIGKPAFDWPKELPAAQWSGTGWPMDVIGAALTATAHVPRHPLRRSAATRARAVRTLMVRDGSIMSAALLRMGHAKEVLQFIRW